MQMSSILTSLRNNLYTLHLHGLYVKGTNIYSICIMMKIVKIHNIFAARIVLGIVSK